MGRKKQGNREETCAKIQDTFIELCREKSIERITIGELTKRAQVNRSTFYYYYEDIYSLQQKVEEDFMQVIEETFPHIIEGMLSLNFDDHIKVIQQFYQKNCEKYRFFLVEKPNLRVRTKIQNYTIDYALHLIGLSREQLTKEQRLVVEYVANAQFGLISYWLEKGQDISVQELSGLITKVNMQGPFPTLLQTIPRKCGSF